MKPNGCHSMPRPTPATTYVAQKGWSDVYGQPQARMPIYVDVPHVMSCACQYSQTTNDPRCGAFPDLAMPVCPHKYVKP